MKYLNRILIGFVVIILLVIANPSLAKAETDPTQLAKAVQEIENLDAMRSGLASTLEDSTTEPTIETFKEVCKPVGMRAMQLIDILTRPEGAGILGSSNTSYRG